METARTTSAPNLEVAIAYGGNGRANFFKLMAHLCDSSHSRLPLVGKMTDSVI